MELEIRPQPSEEERAAIAAALALVADERPGRYASRWRAAGLREGTGAEDDGP